jgi:CheY-like chemotaxis protein
MKGNVLVAENDSSNRLLIAKALEKDGFEYDEADGYDSAMDKLKTKEFDVLLADKNRLNHVFQVFRTAERTLLEHRQLLAEIQVCAEDAMEHSSKNNPLHTALKQISQKAALRL